jgi:hypothetical protein
LCKRNSLKGFYKKKYIDRFLSRELFKRNFVRILDAEISILSHKSHRNEPFNAEMMMETHFRRFLTVLEFSDWKEIPPTITPRTLYTAKEKRKIFKTFLF